MWYMYSDTSYGGTRVLLKEGHIHTNEDIPSLKLLINEQLKSVRKFGKSFIYMYALSFVNIQVLLHTPWET